MDIESKIINLDKKTDFHIHTSNYSEGRNTWDEIKKTAKRLGYTKICLADHSDFAVKRFKSVGISIKRDNITNILDDYVVFGVEADIINNKGIVSDTILGEKKENVILSLHPVFFNGDNPDEAFINAIKNYKGKITAIGHLNCSKNFDKNKFTYSNNTFTMKGILKIIKLANKKDIPLEFNAGTLLKNENYNPALELILKKGNKILLNSDAHTIGQFCKSREVIFKYLKDNKYIK
jgi:histidinol phosphatase-like PHP family hydrolase